MGSLLQIRNVPEDARRSLKAKAAAEGKSLNAYLLELIDREATRPSTAEVLERAATRWEVSTTSTADIVRAARNERDRQLIRRRSK